MSATTVGVARPAGRSRARWRWRPRPSRLVLHLAIGVALLVWLLPTLGMLVNSFRPSAEVSRSGWWTVLLGQGSLTLDDYAYVLNRQGIGNAFVNSLLITIPATVLPVGIAAIAGYAFAWMRFPGRDWLFVLTVALLAVPIQVTLVPVLRLLRETGLSGQFVAVWLVGTGYALPFCILLMRNAMAELPREVLESASLDGASPARTLRSVALPMTLPAVGALAIFQFLFVWNDLLVTLVILGPSNPANLPLTVVIANLSNSIGGDWQYLMAAAFLSAALPLAIFFVFQRAFVRGLTAGAIKG